jgi:hypothetical protein
VRGALLVCGPAHARQSCMNKQAPRALPQQGARPFLNRAHGLRALPKTQSGPAELLLGHSANCLHGLLEALLGLRGSLPEHSLDGLPPCCIYSLGSVPTAPCVRPLARLEGHARTRYTQLCILRRKPLLTTAKEPPVSSGRADAHA